MEGVAVDGVDASSEGTGGRRKLTEQARWRAIVSAAGVRQGGPLSCFFAALGLVRCLLAARKAIDDYNGVVRVPEVGAVVSAVDRKAMAEEVEYIHKTNLYTQVPRSKAIQLGATIITVRWVDIKKGDAVFGK